MLIRDSLRRDLSRKIEEIIKVDQTDEAVVHEEISDYVVTPGIRDYYRRVLADIAEAPKTLSEGVGIWVSGFFGSGKSAFAKNLGYVLENRTVLGEPAAEIFKRRVDDHRVANLLDSIHTMFPTKVIMFDVQSDRSLGPERRSIAHYMYRVLLRELDYAEDFDLAELEMTLEDDGKLDEFCERAEKRFAEPWSLRRKKALKMSEASAVLHDMDPATYPTPDSWATGRAGKEIEATPQLVVDRSYDLVARRMPGHALIYIVDEVGQYIARSSDRIEDVRRIVELLGKEGRNRVRGGKAASPIWFVATSQERLDEVVAALGDVRVQMAKVQDRFPIRVDLSPTDIREIVVKRVLEKKPEHEPDIRDLFGKTEGSLKTHAALERTHRRQEFEAGSFAAFHPYLPHHIDLSIDIVAGIRLQPGADRTIGGATRTIIKQAYEILVNDRTRLADEAVGTLVTLDKLFELLEPSLSTEVRKDVDDVDKKFPNSPWCSKVIRAVVLLSFVKDLPRTAQNIGALLYASVEAPSPIKDVQEAIETLVEAQHLHDSEEGYKLLTAHEKSWQTEKRGLEVKPRAREDLVGQLLEKIFEEPSFKAYRYESRSFPINALVRGVGAGKGGIVVEVRRADSEDKLTEEVEGARVDSRNTTDRAYWVFPLNAELDSMVAQLVRANEMIRKYEQLRSQNKIVAEESTSLDEEKRQASATESRLRAKLTQALTTGQLLFKGTSRDVSALAATASEALSKFLGDVIPGLYPHLVDAPVSPRPNDAEDILKAANLDALPAVFGPGGLSMFARSGGAVRFDPDSPAARHVLGFLKDRVDYGEKPTGRTLEDHFLSPPFGWESDVLRVVLAGLFRGGAVRITTRMKTYEDYTEQQSWPALTRTIDFRNATFAPQTAVDIPDLVKAREAYTALTGEDVDVDQQKISQALSEFISSERADLAELIAQSTAERLPVTEVLKGYLQELNAIESKEAQKRVMFLAEEGAALKTQREEVDGLRSAMSTENLERVSRARAVLERAWPALQRAGATDDLEAEAAALEERLQAPDLFGRLHDTQVRSEAIHSALQALLSDVHQQRNDEYSASIDRLNGDERLPQLAEGEREALLQPLQARLCQAFAMDVGDTACAACGATLEQLQSDIAAAPQLETLARRRIVELTAPEPKPTKVIKAAAHFSKVETEEDVDRGIQSLREEILKSLDEGNTTIVE